MEEELKEEEKKESVYVTVSLDYWNEGRAGGFYIQKNQVRKLPDNITPIIATALEQGLLKEVDKVEIERAKQDNRFVE